MWSKMIYKVRINHYIHKRETVLIEYPLVILIWSWHNEGILKNGKSTSIVISLFQQPTLSCVHYPKIELFATICGQKQVQNLVTVMLPKGTKFKKKISCLTDIRFHAKNYEEPSKLHIPKSASKALKFTIV